MVIRRAGPRGRSGLRSLVIATVALAAVTASFGAAWPVERSWTAAEEEAFSRWVAGVGGQSWRSLNHLIRNPGSNPLHDAADDELFLYADCADLPVMLRAYYAYKRRLPFAVTEVHGSRYSRMGNTTAAIHDNLSFGGSVQEFFRLIPQVLHTGNFRTVPEANDSLTYPIAIRRDTLRPGALFYSPEGHVGIVVDVAADGSIYLLDGHPDQTVTRIRFSAKLPWRSQARVGGFRAFRPVIVRDGRVALVGDARELPGFSVEQFELGDYYREVEARLAEEMPAPEAAFERFLREDVFAEVTDRVAAVELGWAVGRERAIPTPSNLYAAEGDWEAYSTPSRDLRLRRAFLQVPDEVRHHVASAIAADGDIRRAVRLGRRLLARKNQLFGELSIAYRRSDGTAVTLTLADIERRLFRLSFNPNHPPELRWGASGKELAGAPREPDRFHESYEREQPWRNRLEKKQGPMSPDDPDNPREPPPHDLSALIADALRRLAAGE